MPTDHLKPKKDYPELTWDLDNWCLMCPDDNSLKGTRDDYTPEVFDEITRSMQHLSV